MFREQKLIFCGHTEDAKTGNLSLLSKVILLYLAQCPPNITHFFQQLLSLPAALRKI